MTLRLSVSHVLILLGALGIFFGNANPLLHLPLVALLYPAALVLLARESFPFRRGWICGLAGASASLYWISWAAHDYGAFPWPLAVPCAVLPGVWVGLWGGLFCLVLSRFFRMGNAGPLRRALAAGLLWYLLEWMRGWAATGFPWLTLGSAQAPWPLLIQGASLIGDYGLSGLFAAAACLAAELICSRASSVPIRAGERAGALVALMLIVSFVAGYGIWRLKSLPLRDPLAAAGMESSLSLALVQGNVPQDIKWEPAFQEHTVDKYLELSVAALAAGEKGAGGVDLVVWPETAMPFYFQLGGELPARLREFARNKGVWLLFGGPARKENFPGGGDFSRDSSLRNRAFLLNPEGMPESSYDKSHLVPFGEYIPPFLDLPIFEPLLQGVGGFSPGEEGPLPVVRNGKGDSFRLGMLICYEAIFPEIAREHVARGADVLINISNDGWYGRSSAPAQHLYLSVMRAVEQGRWLARGTNTGLTAVSDPGGRLWLLGGGSPESGSGLFEDAWLRGSIWPERERSVYFHLHPLLPALALSLLLLIFFTAKRKQRG